MTHAAQFVLTHGALVLFLWILIQQIGVPIPSAPLLISVGSLASSGRIDFASPLMAALGASLLADTFWYHIGRLGWSRSDYFACQASHVTSYDRWALASVPGFRKSSLLPCNWHVYLPVLRYRL